MGYYDDWPTKHTEDYVTMRELLQFQKTNPLVKPEKPCHKRRFFKRHVADVVNVETRDLIGSSVSFQRKVTFKCRKCGRVAEIFSYGGPRYES